MCRWCSDNSRVVTARCLLLISSEEEVQSFRHLCGECHLRVSHLQLRKRGHDASVVKPIKKQTHQLSLLLHCRSCPVDRAVAGGVGGGVCLVLVLLQVVVVVVCVRDGVCDRCVWQGARSCVFVARVCVCVWQCGWQDVGEGWRGFKYCACILDHRLR